MQEREAVGDALGHHVLLHEALSAGCSPPESEVIAEVPLTTPTMQAVQDSWMGLVTRRTFGLWVVVIGEIW